MLDALDKALALRAAPLFSALPAESVLPIARVCTEVELEQNEALFYQGELGDALFVVVAGNVEVIRHQGHRSPTTLASLGPGECVGEMAAIDWEPRSATVVATEPTQLLRLDRNDLMDLLTHYPTVVLAMAEVLTRRLRAGSAGRTQPAPDPPVE